MSGPPTTRRLFWAVELPDFVCERLLAVQEAVAQACPGEKVRWVRREQMHLTLEFLGETDVAPSELAAAAAAILPAAPVALEVVGLGTFGGRRPRVLWAGVQGAGREELIAFVDRLERAMRKLGFARERRGYSPHVTLGRVRAGKGGRRGRSKLPAALEATGLPGLPVLVSELVLLESSVGQERGPAVYTALERLEFGDPDSPEPRTSR